MATVKYFGPGGQSVTLGSDTDKWAGLSAASATIDTFKGKGSATAPVYFDADGVPQAVTSIPEATHAVNADEATHAESADSAIIADGAATSDKLSTARTITLAGDATGSASFDGSEDVVINVEVSGGSSAASGARVVVNVAEGTLVTCTESETGTVVGQKTADSTGKTYFDVGYGTYIFSIPSEIPGVDVTTSLDITEMKLHTITMTGESKYKLTVTAEAGASVTVAVGGVTQTKTIAEDATSVTFGVLDSTISGTFTISATKNGATVTQSSSFAFSETDTEKTATIAFAKLVITGAASQVVVASMGTYSFSHTFSTDGESYTIYIPELGTWSIVATDADSKVTNTSAKVTEYKTYAVNCATTVYAFKIDGTVSDPAKMITYLEDCASFTPAKMNYNTGNFDWGSWSQDEFFMPRPCMLKYDGTVDYYLNPDNYGLRADTGAASDVKNSSYGGNAMMEWGRDGKKIWYKIVPSGTNNTSATVYIADSQVDSNYHAWSFINSKGEMIDHFYTPIYNGTVISSKMRSLSGQTPTASNTAANEITYAEANNPSGKKMWYTEVYADVTLINLLIMLVGRSTDTQTTFGYGNASSSSATTTGQMDAKGMFWGTQAASTVGVKVFGMENWWGNLRRRYAGHVTDSSYKQLVKLTYGTQDGSTTTGYNTTGSGYLDTGVTLSSSGWLTNETYSNTFGMVPSGVNSGSASTYYSDYYYCGASCYASRGGRWGDTAGCGAFYVDLHYSATNSNSSLAAAISCKPV